MDAREFAPAERGHRLVELGVLEEEAAGPPRHVDGLAAEVDVVARGAERLAQREGRVEVLPHLAERDDDRPGLGEVHRAGVGREIAGEDADERGLAAAVRTEEPETVARAEHEVDVFEQEGAAQRL